MKQQIGRGLAEAIAKSGRTVEDWVNTLEHEENKKREGMEKKYDFVPDLQAWNALTEEVCNVPPEVGIAFLTGRPNLIFGLNPERLEELGKDPKQLMGLVNLVRVLLATNHALQNHCQTVAKRADDLADSLRHIDSVLQNLRRLANFQEPVTEEDG